MPSPDSTPGLVTVFGGSGFIGRHVIRELASRGYRVRAAERRPDLAGYLQPMGGVGQIQAVQANLRFPDSVVRAVSGADAVINLVSIFGDSGKQTVQAINIDGAGLVARAAKAAGANCLVHMSAIGADPGSPAVYGQSKAAGETAVFSVFSDATIFRPSVVFGPEDNFFNRFAAMAESAPFLPLIGGGKTRFQPVYVGDVAAAVANLIDGKAKTGLIYELGGPEVKTFEELMRLVLDYTGRERPLSTIPTLFAKIGALLTKPLPLSLRPLTYDQVLLLAKDNVVSKAAETEGRTLAGLGVAHPATIAAIVPAYLQRYSPGGQFAAYRG